MSYCKKNLNPFQRRSMQLIGAMLGSSVAIGVALQEFSGGSHVTSVTYDLTAVLASVPIIGTLIVIGRYLAGEKDEYLRQLVVQSVLWGFGLVMVADTFLGYIVEYHSIHLPFGLLNMDIFVITAMIALRIQLWRNR